MKPVFYELNKVLNKKVFYIFLALCFLINGFLLYSTQNIEENQMRLDYSDEYVAALSKYSKLSVKDAQKEIENERLSYSIATKMNQLPQLDDKDEIEYYTSELEKYKLSNPDAYKRALEISENPQEDMHSYIIVNLISNQIDYINSYSGFIGEMRNRADNQSKISSFSDKNSFSYKNLYKTVDDYKHLKNNRLTLVNTEPVTSAVEFGVTDIVIIAIVFLICIYLFNFEREQSLYSLVKCTPKGRLNTIFAKIIALFITTTVTVVIFAGSNFVVSTAIYGSTDLGASIQSVPEFRNCTFALNIMEFELIFILFKVITTLITASFVAFVFITFSSPFLMYAVGAGALGAEYLLYTVIDSGSELSLLKYINIFYMFDGGEFIGHYLNLDLFSNIVTANVFVTAFFGICFLGLLFATCVQFCLRVQQKKASVLSGVFERLKAKFYRIKGSTSIFVGELFKFLVQNKMAVVLILLTVYAVYSSIGVVRYPFVRQSDYQYKVYMEHLSGEITTEKEKYIADEQAYLDGLEQKITKIYEDDSLNDNAKQAMARSVQNIIEGKQEAFERVLEQYDRLKELEKQGVEARFIDENIYQVFVSSPTREWNNFMMFTLLVIILLPCIFTAEYKNKMINLIRPTRNGKLRLYIRKMIIALLATVLVFAEVTVPYIIRFVSTYGTDSFRTSLMCLYGTLSATTMNVIIAFCVNMLCCFLILLTFMCVSTLVSVITKNNLYVMIICSVVLLAPCLACYSIESVRVGYLVANGNTVGLFILVVMCAVISAVSLIFTAKMFTNTSLRSGKNEA